MKEMLKAVLLVFLANSYATASTIHWHSADDKMIQQALCRNKLPTSSKEIQNYFDKKYGKTSSLDSGSITFEESFFGNFKFQNEHPELILALRQLIEPDIITKAFEVYGTPLSFEQEARLLKIPKHCQRALCLSQAIFGAEVGPQMLFLKDEFKINTSPYSFGLSTFFNESEIKDVILAFELIPPHARMYPDNQKLTRFPRSRSLTQYGANASSVAANATISLFDLWERQNSYQRQYTIYHEIGHVYANSSLGRYDESTYWMNIGGWDAQKQDSKRIKSRFVSEYATTNSAEDFAESVSAYRLNPQLLKTTSPERYEYLKYLVFDRVEYTSTNSCKRSPEVLRIQDEVLKNTNSLTSQQDLEVKNNCGKYYYWSMAMQQPFVFFKQCVDFEASKRLYQNILAHDTSTQKLYPKDLPVKTWYDSKNKIGHIKFPDLHQRYSKELAVTMAEWTVAAIKEYQKYGEHQVSSDELKDLCKPIVLSMRYTSLVPNYVNDENTSFAIPDIYFNMGAWLKSNGITISNSGFMSYCMDLTKTGALQWNPEPSADKKMIIQYLNLRLN